MSSEISNLKPSKKEEFTEEKFIAHQKSIENEIKKYDTNKLIRILLSYLHAPYQENITYLKRHPWLILLLIKWSILQKRAFKHGRPAPTEPQVFQILNLMLDLGTTDIARMPSQYDDIRLFLRAIAYQQFMYQQEIKLTTIARQKLYFETITEKDYISTKFLELTGIKIFRFLELSQLLLCRFHDGKDNKINQEWFNTVEFKYPKEEVFTFLESISKTFLETKAALSVRDNINSQSNRAIRSPAEYWEQTPFIDYPLIKIGKSYLYWDKHVLFLSIESFIYNKLRLHNPKLFMSHFGPLFERYVERSIRHMDLPFTTEEQIKKLPGKGNVIDFLIVDNESNIFIEAKGAEMAYQGKSAFDSLELAKWLETSALKAIKQAHSVLERLPNSDDKGELLRRRNKNYLITVTYDDINVGNGRILSSAVGMPTLEPLMNSVPKELAIPLENMYFMTIKEFDLVAEAVRSKQISLTELLDYAINQDSDFKTQKFKFEQHLASIKIKILEPEYLVSQVDVDLHELAKNIRPQ